MAEENAVLSSQLANMHLQGGHQNWGFNGVETISLKEKLQGALSREFALRVEIDKVSFSNIIYGLLIFLKKTDVFLVKEFHFASCSYNVSHFCEYKIRHRNNKSDSSEETSV